MLQFIFGRAATGKTHTVLKKIGADVGTGRRVILLVPEQFTFETEKAVLEALGDHDAAAVSVMSFTRLCDAVDRETGGICGRKLSQADKLVLMSRAVRAAAGDLRLWSRYAHSAGFTSSMLDTVEEFKLNAVTAEDLFAAADAADTPSLSAKLHDTGMILNQYTALVGERFLDPTDRLTALADKLLHFDFFSGVSVYLDSFKGFTGQQYALIDRILAQAAQITVSLTNDPVDFHPFDLFENVRKTADRIRRLAKNHHVAAAADIVLKQHHYSNASLAAVEELLSHEKQTDCPQDGAVTVCRAATVYDEAEFAARTIRRLVRENGYRYRDFVMIARDTAPYEEAVAAACDRNGVHCFFDKRIPLSAFPPVVAALSAIRAVRSFSTEQVLRFEKSGLGTLQPDEIATLENYTFLWNITGELWTKEWDMNPRGLVSDTEQSDSDDKQIRMLNELRQRAVTPLTEFREQFRGAPRDMAAAIVHLFETCHAKKALKAEYDAFCADGKRSYADALRQSWDIFMDLLDSLVACMGEGEQNREFCDALENAVALSTIGVAPQMLDEVMFGAADRIRPSRPLVAFILGANQGIFPAVAGANGLFGANDREKLIGLGIEIPDHTVGSAIDEDYLVYTNLCCATDRLYLSYALIGPDNKDREPSSFIGTILAATGCRTVAEPDVLSAENLPETEDTAFSEYCVRRAALPSDAQTIFSAFPDDGAFVRRAEAVCDASGVAQQQLSPETARSLFGTDMDMSASRFETYHRCAFQHFCRYGLRAKRLQPADFDVMQRGTLVHYVLQRLIEEYHKDVALLDETKISDAVDRYIAEYIDSIRGFASVNNAHLQYLISNIARSIKEVATHIAAEFAQSEFEPVACELTFGMKGAEPCILSFSGGTIRLQGSIDRVDAWNGYVRIVDYKTGKRSFQLPDILFGQNLQMLIYLYSLTKREEYAADKPAGIFYMPAKRDIRNNGLRMNGLLVGDPDLVHAMERENDGEFVPPYVMTNGGTLNQKYAAPFITEEQFGQIFRHIEWILRKTGEELLAGTVAVSPLDGRADKACKYCDYSAVCRIGDAKCPQIPAMKKEEIFAELEKEGQENGISGDERTTTGD